MPTLQDENKHKIKYSDMAQNCQIHGIQISKS